MEPLQFLLPEVRPWCQSIMCKRENPDLGPHKATYIVHYRCPCKTLDAWCDWRVAEIGQSLTSLVGHFSSPYYDCGLVLTPTLYPIGDTA